MSEVQRLDQVSKSLVRRVKTGIFDFDCAYGYTRGSKSDGEFVCENGFPLKKLSLWSGESGVGKTRLAIKICAELSRWGRRILYVQNEASASDFNQWAAPFDMCRSNCYLTESNDPKEHYRMMLDVLPHVMVIDSLNMLEDEGSPKALRNALMVWQKASHHVGTHIILIGHQNERGNVKGNNIIKYLVDVICMLRKAESKMPKSPSLRQIYEESVVGKGIFYIEFVKNRTSKTGMSVIFQHTDKGIDFKGVSHPDSLSAEGQKLKGLAEQVDRLQGMLKGKRGKRPVIVTPNITIPQQVIAPSPVINIAPPIVNIRSSSGKMCYICGAENVVNASFCNKCGKSLDGAVKGLGSIGFGNKLR